ncbi:AAA family ATPase [Pseudomonas sp. MWU12-2029]|uniref:AAA family ATPase n=1 Tax=Pseudomonas sp. MWU12-2029 TaxID=2927805 RepID=UPI00200D77DE|nr:AAA family ATPase [Pseudomonas sp. MWU12-2029]
MDLFISSIKVEKLFGLYSYDLKIPFESSEASILYGDNGVGKSTVLRLAFHLLSADNERGHRNALYNTVFEKLEVSLGTGVLVTALRNKNILELRILEGTKLVAGWDFTPRVKSFIGEEAGSERYVVTEELLRSVLGKSYPLTKNRKNPLIDQDKYLESLKRLMPSVFILNADRRLDSDAVADPSDEVEYRKMMRVSEPRRINDLVVRSREIALSQALNAASKWINKEALLGANQGSMDAHSVYLDVLKHLIRPVSLKKELDSVEELIGLDAIGGLVERLDHIRERTYQLATYELVSSLEVEDFKRVLNRASGDTASIAVRVIKPYIKSLEGRLEALNTVYEIVDVFVSVVNDYLSDKSIEYTLSSGFVIRNRLGDELSPAQLSSGEQQLLLLFCYVLSARDSASVFMIDEPEISLNIKWQRALIQTLLDVTKGASIQFVFASHSMELISQHRRRVVKLEGVKA